MSISELQSINERIREKIEKESFKHRLIIYALDENYLKNIEFH
jgi:hypothetical protein